MKVLLSILFVLVLGSCSKNKKQNCRYYYTNIPASTIIDLADSDDLDTFIVNRYKANDSFNVFLTKDTIFNINFEKTTFGYRLYNSKVDLDVATDAEILLPNIGKSFRISQLDYGGPAYFDEMMEGCLGRSFTRYPKSVKVNGTDVNVTIYNSSPNIVLKAR
jgi:hypothetical protein